MDKNDQMIMVVKRDVLFNDVHGSFEGFKGLKSNISYEEIILQNYDFMRRGDMEKNPCYKQPIAYCIIANLFQKRFFAYQRASNSIDADSRITSNWSWGVGGHIEHKDLVIGKNPLHHSMLREVNEETEFVDGKILSTELLGYINNDTDNIGKVHFGLLYLLRTDATMIKMRGTELQAGQMVTAQHLETLCKDKSVRVDEWSKIAMIPLREKYF